jgi:hypothetical protein
LDIRSDELQPAQAEFHHARHRIASTTTQADHFEDRLIGGVHFYLFLFGYV